MRTLANEVQSQKAPGQVRAHRAIALVGCGLWGRNILRELRHSGVQVFVADPREECRIAAIELGADAAFETAERLPATDGIIVATPATTHAHIVVSLLDRNVPIFVEKPLTACVDDAARLVNLAAGRLFVMHIWRYHPGVRMLAAIAQSGELGVVHGLRSVRANWRSPRTDVDTVWNMAPHDLSLALTVLGHIPIVRFTVAEILDGQTVGMMAVLGDKPWVVIEVSNRYRDKRRELRLHCRNGVAVLPDAEGGFVEITRDGDPNIAYDSHTERRPYDTTPALRLELADFLNYLDGGDPPATDAHEGLAVVTAVAELRRCAGLELMGVKATVLVPTSIDRGPLLPYSVGSIQRQTMHEIEIFIIGDGVEEITRRHVRELMAQDPRIRFFDHPKHRRRGEPYRHAALQEARGEVVCYLCDRDLMLPDHVETMRGLLQDADFATTLLYDSRPDAPGVKGCRDAADPADRARLANGGGYSLSAFGHTLHYYRRLPHGWRETPAGEQTDHYMCRQFLGDPACRAVSGDSVTVIYFNRGAHPGWSVARRLPELQTWSTLLQDPGRTEAFLHRAFWDLMRQEHLRFLRVEPLLSVRMRGMPIGDYLRRQLRRRIAALRI